jgi:hypothetical protein
MMLRGSHSLDGRALGCAPWRDIQNPQEQTLNASTTPLLLYRKGEGLVIVGQTLEACVMSFRQISRQVQNISERGLYIKQGKEFVKQNHLQSRPVKVN